MDNGSTPPGPEVDALHKAIALVIFSVVDDLTHEGEYQRHSVPDNLLAIVRTALSEVSTHSDPATQLHWEQVALHARLILEQLDWWFGHKDTHN